MSYNWTINSMQCYPKYQEQDNVVFKVYFKVTKLAIVNELPYLGVIQQSVEIPFVESSSYIPFDQLTELQVINWVKNTLGEEIVTAYENNVNAQIEAATKPSTITPPVPWATNS